MESPAEGKPKKDKGKKLRATTKPETKDVPKLPDEEKVEEKPERSEFSISMEPLVGEETPGNEKTTAEIPVEAPKKQLPWRKSQPTPTSTEIIEEPLPEPIKHVTETFVFETAAESEVPTKDQSVVSQPSWRKPRSPEKTEITDVQETIPSGKPEEIDETRDLTIKQEVSWRKTRKTKVEKTESSITSIPVDSRESSDMSIEIITKKTDVQESTSSEMEPAPHKEICTEVMEITGSEPESETHTTEMKMKKTTSKKKKAVMVPSTPRTPPMFTKKLQPLSSRPGKKIRFHCQFNGEPAPIITWYRNETLLVTSDRVVITMETGSSVMEISRLELDDTGVYTCRAVNEAGIATTSANVIVAG